MLGKAALAGMKYRGTAARAECVGRNPLITRTVFNVPPISACLIAGFIAMLSGSPAMAVLQISDNRTVPANSRSKARPFANSSPIIQGPKPPLPVVPKRSPTKPTTGSKETALTKPRPSPTKVTLPKATTPGPKKPQQNALSTAPRHSKTYKDPRALAKSYKDPRAHATLKKSRAIASPTNAPTMSSRLGALNNLNQLTQLGIGGLSGSVSQYKARSSPKAQSSQKSRQAPGASVGKATQGYEQWKDGLAKKKAGTR
jgi:hypothetical protein